MGAAELGLVLSCMVYVLIQIYFDLEPGECYLCRIESTLDTRPAQPQSVGRYKATIDPAEIRKLTRELEKARPSGYMIIPQGLEVKRIYPPCTCCYENMRDN